MNTNTLTTLFLFLLIININGAALENDTKPLNYDEESFTLLKNFASKGNEIAQIDVGNMYYFGHYVEKNISKALHWYKKAADQDNAKAQFNVGVLFYEDHNFSEAIIWFKKAGKQNYSQALYNVGHMYSSGHSVTQSYSKGIKWYKKAIKLGNSDAEYRLGFMYLYATGVSYNLKKMEKWYERAADKGNQLAIEALKIRKEKLKKHHPSPRSTYGISG